MIFQNIEFLETDKFQYLLIHKNGCTSVTNLIEKFDYFVTENKNLHKIRWTVIRDPFERFISGLDYDLKSHNLKLKDIKLENLFVSKINKQTRTRGFVNHTCSQSLYLINADINWYININDLDIFLKMHFGTTLTLNKNNNKSKLNINKKEVMKYLNIDYEIYNQIMNSENLWEWQKGKIF
jgi:hypothetical protein